MSLLKFARNLSESANAFLKKATAAALPDKAAKK
jgi:hypothetical protein